MGKPLRVLLVEDSKDDAALLARELRRTGFDPEITLVETEAGFSEALQRSDVDVILCDYKLPAFDAFTALDMIHTAGIDLPFIVVSGVIGEDRLIRLMQLGAQDIVLKDKLARLAPAINRELVDVAMRRERKRAEQALRQSEARFRGVVDNSPSAIFLQNLDGRFLLVNKRFEAWQSLAAEEVLGQTAEDIFPQEVAAGYATQDHLVLETGESVVREYAMPFADGESHQVIVTKFPVMDSRGRTLGVGTVGTDVTERRLAEAKLRQAQKMEAVGQLTGGIAHDFNNLLTVVIGNLQLLRRSHPEDERLQKRVATALLSAQRGSDLTARLMAFSRQQVLEAETVSLNELVSEMAEMLHRTLGASVTVEMALDPALEKTRIDPSQMGNALLNLAINARDAMPEGGTLRIATANVVLGPGDPLIHDDVPPGAYVTLAVSDTGCGMTGEVLERAFDPFFTTKEIGQGTGLGLSMVYGFVQQSNGRVRIYSEPQQGTTVRVYLPSVRDAEQERWTGKPVPTDLERGTETIMVVEDEDDVRETAVAILENLGYRVVAAADAGAALAMLNERPDIDLLFTDVVMPGGMTGPELAKAVKSVRPDIKVLLTSGYAGASRSGESPPSLDFPWVTKPYQEHELARQIRATLDQAAD